MNLGATSPQDGIIGQFGGNKNLHFRGFDGDLEGFYGGSYGFFWFYWVLKGFHY